MCAACVSQGLLYVGGAAGALRVMAARSKARRTLTIEHPDGQNGHESLVAAPRGELAGGQMSDRAK